MKSQNSKNNFPKVSQGDNEDKKEIKKENNDKNENK